MLCLRCIIMSAESSHKLVNRCFCQKFQSSLYALGGDVIEATLSVTFMHMVVFLKYCDDFLYARVVVWPCRLKNSQLESCETLTSCDDSHSVPWQLRALRNRQLWLAISHRSNSNTREAPAKNTKLTIALCCSELFPLCEDLRSVDKRSQTSLGKSRQVGDDV